MKYFTLAVAAFFCGLTHAQTPPLKLHVPSPDWRDQVIYFVMTDRFADGDLSNNDQGAGVYKQGDSGKYQGGDLRGLSQRLDYIKGLGATAVWITPPVANQWFDPIINYTGYHGYWATDFKAVDKHLGTLADYQNLSHELHSRGMYLVQDIVVNHTGNFFDFSSMWTPQTSAQTFLPNLKSLPVTAPTQAPFDRNDPRDGAQRNAAIYHWTPGVKNYNDRRQVLSHQMSGLDDLNTENPVVRRALRESYGHWISAVGVDAFRVDTAFYVPPDYFRDFMFSEDASAPGMARVAKITGRDAFHVFGEGFAMDKPFADKESQKIESYVRDARGRALLPAMINFPLYGAFTDVFALGKPPAILADRIERMMRLHRAPHLMPTFIDNHDVDRFLNGGKEAAFKQALVAMFTLPGIPTIYYGNEQGFTERRASMFAKGFGANGKDHYDTSAPLYKLIAQLAQLRREERVLSRGVPTVLFSHAARAGAVVWRMRGKDGDLVVALNTSDAEAFVDKLNFNAVSALQLQPLFSAEGQAPALKITPKTALSITLPARAAWVWRVEKPQEQAAPKLAIPAAQILLKKSTKAIQTRDFTLHGRAQPNAALQLIVDGDIGNARALTADSRGAFAAKIETRAMNDASVTHRVVVRDPATQRTQAQSFRVALPWQKLASHQDPAGDDRGRSGQVVYPTDKTYAGRQMDLRAVSVYGAGSALRIDATMANISRVWSPVNGFDHIVLTVYIELPSAANTGSSGATVMPLQFGDLPQGMRWHRRLRAHGWSNALFSSEGASAAREGAAVAPGASVAVDLRGKTISLTLSAAALGNPASLHGAKVYLTTWDYDSGYRSLAPQAGAFSFGGAEENSPRVMDDTPVLVLQVK